MSIQGTATKRPLSFESTDDFTAYKRLVENASEVGTINAYAQGLELVDDLYETDRRLSHREWEIFETAVKSANESESTPAGPAFLRILSDQAFLGRVMLAAERMCGLADSTATVRFEGREVLQGFLSLLRSTGASATVAEIRKDAFRRLHEGINHGGVVSQSELAKFAVAVQESDREFKASFPSLRTTDDSIIRQLLGARIDALIKKEPDLACSRRAALAQVRGPGESAEEPVAPHEIPLAGGPQTAS